MLSAMKRTILTIIFLAVSLSAFSANQQFVYTQIAQNKGLTSTVNCIYKEKDGDVWIGTPNGLYRFDGYSLDHYEEQLHGSRQIFHISMDRNEALWVLTDRHVLRRDAGSDTFRKISDTVSDFYCMAYGDDCIWIGADHSLYRYAEGTMKLHMSLPAPYDCRFIEVLDGGSLLCCSQEGKIIVNQNRYETISSTFGEATEVSATLTDSQGRIWIGLYNKGIEVYDKEGQKLKSYNTGNSSLSCDIVLCLAEKDSTILVGTDGGGVNIINPESDSIRVLSHISGDATSFPASSIKSLHIDHYGNIWAGSVRKGLISISQSDMHFYNDSHKGLNSGLSDPTVLCLHQDKDSGLIWIGTDGEGINSYNPATGKFRHYQSTFRTKVVSIADYSDTELAVSTHSDDIWIFNKTTGRLRLLHIDDKNLKYDIRHSGRSINLFNEHNGGLLLFSNEIYRYDKSGRCSRIGISDSTGISSNLYTLGRNSEGVWFHDENRIYILKPHEELLVCKGRHEHGNIRSGHLAENGTIWLATEEGLCKFDSTTGKFTQIKTRLFSDANSVICDKQSRVWIGTDKLLAAYLSEAEAFATFGASDGAAPNEYLPCPHLLADNGDIYLGGVQGLLHIKKQYEIDALEKPVLTLNEVALDGNNVNVCNEKELKTDRDCRSLSISLSVQEKDMFRHRQYRFYLSDRIYETSSPVLTLRQMPKPGKYPIYASCTKRNGKWTEPAHIMTMTVPQPWFFTWWSISGFALFLLASYFTAIYSINRRKSHELALAVKEQKEKIYEEKVNMLINISHELRTPLTLITAPLKRLLNSIDRSDDNFAALSRIYRQSRRMRALLDMVLDLRKMEEGDTGLKLDTVNFNTWISTSVNDIVDEEKTESIDIIFDFDDSVQQVEIDKQKCDIVLMNVLINAIKHSSPADTITIQTRLMENGVVRTSVCDQGPGLSSDIDPAKLFTRFYQSKSEKYGSGLGLSYSKILVEMHGGQIGVINNPDKGATFWWELPLKAADGLPAEARAYINELLGHSSEVDILPTCQTVFNTSGMSLMIVDDNQDFLDFLREAMSGDFAEIVTVTGGKAAMQNIVSGKLPDIIVSDVNMPEGDGFWLCNELKSNEKYRHIPFVLLTARGEDQSQSESYRLGADGFLAKPFEVETLMELIRSLLRNKAEIRKRYLDNETASEADYGSNEEKFILQLNHIVSENLSNPALDQQLICRELGVSRALLYNKMKAITGAGTKEYITKIRIEKAKFLIESTSLTIAEISDMTGFASQSYFSTAFKNYTRNQSKYIIGKRSF